MRSNYENCLNSIILEQKYTLDQRYHKNNNGQVPI